MAHSEANTLCKQYSYYTGRNVRQPNYETPAHLISQVWSPRATSHLTFLACSWCHDTSSSSDASSTRTLLLLFLNIIHAGRSAVYQKHSISKPMRCQWRLFVRRSQRLNQNNNPTVIAPCPSQHPTRTLSSGPLSSSDERLSTRLAGAPGPPLLPSWIRLPLIN